MAPKVARSPKSHAKPRKIAPRAQTPSKIRTRSHSRRLSPSPAASPPPPLPQTVVEPTLLYTPPSGIPTCLKWIEDHRNTDVVFGNSSAAEQLRRSLSSSLQPVEHCFPEFFPQYAALYGFDRWIPTPVVEVGGKGPKCLVDGKRGQYCHKPSLPAFLYTHSKVSCKQATAKGWPTLVFRWTHDEQGLLLPNACWACHTRGGRDPCQISGVALKPSDPTKKIVLEKTPSTEVVSTKRTAEEAGGMLQLHISDTKRPKLDAGDDVAAPYDLAPTINESLGVPDLFDAGHGTVETAPVALLGAETMSLPGEHLTVGDDLRGRSSRQGSEISNVPQRPDWRRTLANMKTRARSTTPMSLSSRPTPGDGFDSQGPKSSTMATVQENHLETSRHVSEALGDASRPAGEQGGSSVPSAPAGDIESIQQLRGELDQQIDKVLDDARDTVGRLEIVRLNATGKLDKLFKLCQQLGEQSRNDRANIDIVRKERDQHLNTMNGLDLHIKSLNHDITEQKKEIKTLKRTGAFVDQQLEDHKKQVVAIDSRLNTSIAEQQNLREQLAEIRSENKMLREKLASTEQEKAETEIALEACGAEVDKLANELSKAQEVEQTLLQQLDHRVQLSHIQSTRTPFDRAHIAGLIDCEPLAPASSALVAKPSTYATPAPFRSAVDQGGFSDSPLIHMQTAIRGTGGELNTLAPAMSHSPSPLGFSAQLPALCPGPDIRQSLSNEDDHASASGSAPDRSHTAVGQSADESSHTVKREPNHGWNDM